MSVPIESEKPENDIGSACQGKEEDWDDFFSQLTDQFMVIRNYAKITTGLFAGIIGKISALTILQYVDFVNNKPIGRIKYALT